MEIGVRQAAEKTDCSAHLFLLSIIIQKAPHKKTKMTSSPVLKKFKIWMESTGDPSKSNWQALKSTNHRSANLYSSCWSS